MLSLDTSTYDAVATALDAFLAAAGQALEQPDTSSSRLAELGEMAAVHRKRIEAEQQAAESAVQDPSRTRDQLKSSKEHLEAVKVDFFRLAHIAEKLDAAYLARITIEQEARRVAAYDAAKRERDEIVAEYPEVQTLIDKIVDFNKRQLANDDEIDRVNKDLPAGMSRLNRSEGEGRGFPDFEDQTAASLSTFRLVQCQLPDLNDRKKAAWPPQLPYETKILRRGMVFSVGQVRAMFRQSKS